MTHNELKKLIKSGDVNLIRFYGHSDGDKLLWTVSVYGSPSVFSFGSTLMNSSRDGTMKDYTSLDRAYQAMKNAGYKGRLEVDDGS